MKEQYTDIKNEGEENQSQGNKEKAKTSATP